LRIFIYECNLCITAWYSNRQISGISCNTLSTAPSNNNASALPGDFNT